MLCEAEMNGKPAIRRRKNGGIFCFFRETGSPAEQFEISLGQNQQVVREMRAVFLLDILRRVSYKIVINIQK